MEKKSSTQVGFKKIAGMKADSFFPPREQNCAYF